MWLFSKGPIFHSDSRLADRSVLSPKFARKPLEIEHLHRQRNHNQMRIRCCRSVTEQYIKISQLTDAQIGHLLTSIT